MAVAYWQELLNSFRYLLLRQTVEPFVSVSAYLSRYPGIDVAHDLDSVLSYYFERGEAEGQTLHPLFDPVFYGSHYPEARECREGLFFHFLTEGQSRGWFPNPLFDPPWYLSQVPEAAFAPGGALGHYIAQGEAASRRPNPLFDPSWYRLQVADAAMPAGALAHYLAEGEPGGLHPNPLFDPLWYRHHAASLQPDENALAHYRHHGELGGLWPNPLFNPAQYLARYPDVGGSRDGLLGHYLLHGEREGRQPNPFFDPVWYLETYPDVAGSPDGLLGHFLRHGDREGRLPSAQFATHWYGETHSDAHPMSDGRLAYHMRHGEQEGRITHPARMHPVGTPETPLRVLVLTNHMADLSGSELVALDVLRHFTERGDEVVLGCNYLDDPLRGLLPERLTIECQIQNLSLINFDLIWCQHDVLSLVPEAGWPDREPHNRFPLVVYAVLSPFEPYENFNPGLASALGAEIWANSHETVGSITQRCRGEFRAEGIENFRNAVPGKRWPLRAQPSAPDALRRVLVVSNHLPVELVEALQQLEALGVEVLRMGIGHDYRLVESKDLQGVDACITIGRTAVYALLSGTPLYVYDHFGGSGWIGSHNVAAQQAFNFSGRPDQRRLEAGELVAELLEGYSQARDEMVRCPQWLDRDSLDLDGRLERLRERAVDPASIISRHDRFRRFIARSTNWAFAEYTQCTHMVMRRAYLENRALRRGMEQTPGTAMAATAVGSRRFWLSSQETLWENSLLAASEHVPLVVLLRVRNEELVIEDTLDHLASFADIIVAYDDASTDTTLARLKAHPKVGFVVENHHWQASVEDRLLQETRHRGLLLEEAQARWSFDWCMCCDADERYLGPIRTFVSRRPDATSPAGIRIQLFDAYMTPDDHADYEQGKTLLDFRHAFGPERRDILMLWRNTPDNYYIGLDAREPKVSGVVETHFYCQHYGKSLSVAHWEDTCEYYVSHFPWEPYGKKWDARRGKGIHTLSDFGRPLLPWGEALFAAASTEF